MMMGAAMLRVQTISYILLSPVAFSILIGAGSPKLEPETQRKVATLRTEKTRGNFPRVNPCGLPA